MLVRLCLAFSGCGGRSGLDVAPSEDAGFPTQGRDSGTDAGSPRSAHARPRRCLCSPRALDGGAPVAAESGEWSRSNPARRPRPGVGARSPIPDPWGRPARVGLSHRLGQPRGHPPGPRCLRRAPDGLRSVEHRPQRRVHRLIVGKRTRHLGLEQPRIASARAAGPEAPTSARPVIAVHRALVRLSRRLCVARVSLGGPR